MAYDSTLVSPAPVLANYNRVLYVAKTGDDNDNGLSKTYPLLTIGKALTKVLANDNALIIIKGGGYSERLLSPTGTPSTVTLYGDKNCNFFAGVPGTRIQLTSASYPIIQADFVKEIHNIEITYSGTTSNIGAGFIGNPGSQIDNKKCSINNCKMDHTSTGALSWVTSGVADGLITLNNCSFSRGTTLGGYFASPVYNTTVVFNDCTFPTGYNAFFSSTLTYSPARWFSVQFYNCSEIVLNGTINPGTTKGQLEVVFENCGNIKLNAQTNPSAYLFNGGAFDLYGARGCSYVKDCNIVDSALNQIPIKNIYYLEGYSYTSITAEGWYNQTAPYWLRLDNVNGFSGIMGTDFQAFTDTTDVDPNGKPAMKFWAAPTSHIVGFRTLMRFYVEKNVSTTLNVPLVNLVSAGNISTTILGRTQLLVSGGILYNSNSVGTSWVTRQLTFTPAYTGWHYLMFVGSGLNKHFEIGEITIS